MALSLLIMWIIAVHHGGGGGGIAHLAHRFARIDK